MSDPRERQLLRLSTLLQVQGEIRRAPRDQLPFLAVNRLNAVVRYRQAALWMRDKGGTGRMLAASGVAVADPEGALGVLVARLASALGSDKVGGTPRALASGERVGDPAAWDEALPGALYWAPLVAPDGTTFAGLLLARDEAWTEADGALLAPLVETLALAWLAHGAGRRAVPSAPRPLLAQWGRWAALALLALGLVPIRESALAPAELVPRAPALVRAPLDGVVERLLVAPNEPVTAGQPVARLDGAALEARRALAETERDIARAAYGQAAQAALADPAARADLTLLEGRIAQAEAELAFAREQAARLMLTAPAAGLAVIDDPASWPGRAVRTGERIVLVADPAELVLEVLLPADSRLAAAAGQAVAFFPNADPHRPVAGRVTRVAYGVGAGPDGRLVRRVEATLDATGPEPGGAALGSRGTARLSGDWTLAALWALREPLAALRLWLGV